MFLFQPLEVKKLVAKILMKSSDTTTPEGEKYEWAIVEKTKDGRIRYRRLGVKEVGEFRTFELK